MGQHVTILEVHTSTRAIHILYLQINDVGVSNKTAFGVMEFCRLSEQNVLLPRTITIQVKFHSYTDFLHIYQNTVWWKLLTSSSYAVFLFYLLNTALLLVWLQNAYNLLCRTFDTNAVIILGLFLDSSIFLVGYPSSTRSWKPIDCRLISKLGGYLLIIYPKTCKTYFMCLLVLWISRIGLLVLWISRLGLLVLWISRIGLLVYRPLSEKYLSDEGAYPQYRLNKY